MRSAASISFPRSAAAHATPASPACNVPTRECHFGRSLLAQGRAAMGRSGDWGRCLAKLASAVSRVPTGRPMALATMRAGSRGAAS
jgi:hypothetical protein